MSDEKSAISLVPEALLPAIEAAAAEERRTARELVGEAVERYLIERQWFRELDIDRKIAEGLRSLVEGEAVDGETAMAELLAELETRSER